MELEKVKVEMEKALDRVQMEKEKVKVEMEMEKALDRVQMEKEKLVELADMKMKMTIDSYEKQLLQARDEKLRLEAQSVAVLCNRHLLEIGLHRRSPHKSLTQAYQAFLPTLLSGSSLTPVAEELLKNLQGSAKQGDVAKELKDLVHELSKDIHYPVLKETGHDHRHRLTLLAVV
jgi:hypothetical protein